MSDIINKIEELERKVALYEAVLELLNVGIHVIDVNQKTILYNKAMSRMEGEDPSRVLNRPFMVENNYFQDQDSTLLKVLKTAETVSDYTQRYRNSQGQPVITVNSTQPLFIDGKMTGALETASEVTHIQLLAEKIMDLHQKSSKLKKKTMLSKSCPELS